MRADRKKELHDYIPDSLTLFQFIGQEDAEGVEELARLGDGLPFNCGSMTPAIRPTQLSQRSKDLVHLVSTPLYVVQNTIRAIFALLTSQNLNEDSSSTFRKYDSTVTDFAISPKMTENRGTLPLIQPRTPQNE